MQLLYGDSDFSGRLAATVYREAWINASHMADSRISAGPQPRGYRYMPGYHNPGNPLVLFRFGDGESYASYSTQFGQSHYSISAADLSAGAKLTVMAKLTMVNSGGGRSHQRKYSRSLLLFLSPPKKPVAGITDNDDTMATRLQKLPPRTEWLGDFSKIHGISPLAVTEVKLTLGMEALSRWVPASLDPAAVSFTDGKYVVVKGKYEMRLTDSKVQATLHVT